MCLGLWLAFGLQKQDLTCFIQNYIQNYNEYFQITSDEENIQNMHTHVEITSDQMLIDGSIRSIQLIFIECLILGTDNKKE